jgi:exodeoxyribonuclease III
MQSTAPTEREQGLTTIGRLVNWNIWWGGWGREGAILKALRRYSPDVVVLSEFQRGKSGEEILAGLFGMGLRHTSIPLVTGTKNTVLIASRYTLQKDTQIAIPPELREHATAVTIRGVTLLGTFCATEKLGDSFLQLLNELASRSGLILATGDFNYGPRGSNLKRYDAYLSPVVKAGWVDTWVRDAQGHNEWSYYDGWRGVSRPDHLFALRETSARVVSHVRFSQAELRARISDHAPMIAELQFQGENGWPKEGL